MEHLSVSAVSTFRADCMSPTGSFCIPENLLHYFSMLRGNNMKSCRLFICLLFVSTIALAPFVIGVQDLQAKKYALIANSLMAIWVSENRIFASSRMTTAGRAFCCFFLGSLFLKALKSLDRNLPSSPSWSLEGSGRLFSLKV